MDPFDELGLKQGQCTEDDVTKAFRKLALKNHPDKAGPAGTERMKSINAARDRIMKEKLCSKPPPAAQRPSDARTQDESSSKQRPDEPRPRSERLREHYASEPSPHDTRSQGGNRNDRGPNKQRYHESHTYDESTYGADSYDRHSQRQRQQDEDSYERGSYKRPYQDDRSPHDRSHEPRPREQHPRDESSYERQSYKQRYSERPSREQRPYERHPHEERAYERSTYKQQYSEQRPEGCRSHKRNPHEEHYFEEYYYEKSSYEHRPQSGRPHQNPHPDPRAQLPRQRPPQPASSLLELEFWENMPDLMRDVRVFLSETRPICTNTGRTPRTVVRELHDEIQAHLHHPFKSGKKERICSLLGSLLFAIKKHELLNARTDRDAHRVEVDYTLKYTMSELDWVKYEADGSFLVEAWLYDCMPGIERQWRREELRWEVEGVWKM